MNPQEIFQKYAGERRARPLAGFRLEALPHLSRYTALEPGGEGFIQFTRLPQGEEARLIDEQVRYFAALGQAFEWKVYAFDSPANLGELLEQRGFACEAEEVFLVLPAAAAPAAVVLPAGVRLTKVTDERGLRDVSSVMAAGESAAAGNYLALLAQLLREAPEENSLYCLYEDGVPAATARIEFLPGSIFAGLFGAVVRPECRGRGFYSALLQVRTEEARLRGCAYLAADAAPMSLPILLRKGFRRVCVTRPLRLQSTGTSPG